MSLAFTVLRRRNLLGLTLAGLVVVPCTARAEDIAAITAPVRALDDGLVAAMQAGKKTLFRDRFHALAPAIDRAFDLPGILRVSVGAQWAGIDPTQQDTLLKVFRTFTIASYVANFDSYDGQRFDIAPTLRTIGAERVVATTLVPQSGDKVSIDYVMRQEGDSWKVTDVLLDGTISRVAVQRSDFRSLLAQGGAAALIVSLQAKVIDLAGGALES
jgi:phospholipid transport system substrate-binding protein